MSPEKTRMALLTALLSTVVVVAHSRAAPAPAAPDVTVDLKYLPGDTCLLFVIRMDQLLASDGFKKLRKDVPDFDKHFADSFRQEFGFEIGNVATMIYGGNVKSQPIGVFHLKQAVKAETIQQAMSRSRYPGDKGTAYKEEKIGALTLHASDQEYRQSFCLVNEKTLLVGRVKDLKPALGRESKPDNSAGLKTALKLVDPSATVSLVFDTKAVFTAEKPPMIPGVDFNKIIDGVSGATLNIKVGSDVVLHGIAACKDATAAEEVKKQAEALQQFAIKALPSVPAKLMPKEVLEVPGKVKFATKGSQASATVTVKDDVAVAFFKMTMFSGSATAPSKTAESSTDSKPPVEKKP